MEFWELFNEKSNLHQWFTQVEGDANFVGKEPMLVVKINNHKRFVFVKDNIENFVFQIKNWRCLWLEDLLKQPDDFFKVQS